MTPEQFRRWKMEAQRMDGGGADHLWLNRFLVCARALDTAEAQLAKARQELEQATEDHSGLWVES